VHRSLFGNQLQAITPTIESIFNNKSAIIRDSNEKWKQIGTWEFSLDARSWGELTNRGTGCYVNPKGAPQYGEICQPPDLHKYTGSREQIPEDGFGAPPSYLDFPKGQENERDKS
jgi:hypothetical protein